MKLKMKKRKGNKMPLQNIPQHIQNITLRDNITGCLNTEEDDKHKKSYLTNFFFSITSRHSRTSNVYEKKKKKKRLLINYATL